MVCIDDEIPFEVPQGWEWVRMSSLSLMIHYGFTASAGLTGNAKLLRITDIQDGKVHWDDVPFCEIDKKALCNYLLEKDDIVIARTGGTVGKSFIISDNPVVAVFASYLIRIKPIRGLYIPYIAAYLESPCYWRQLTNATSGTGQPNVNGQSLSHLLVPIPPSNEQKRILAEVNSLNPHLQKYTATQGRLDTLNKSLKDSLKKSVLQEAIQGRLVPQNPSDEPVSVLLEHVLKERQKLLKEGALKKKDLVDSVIFKGEDNKYYETIAGRSYEIELPYSFPESWVIVRLKTICALQDGERRTGDGICLDAKYLRGKTAGDHIQSGKYVYAGSNIILVDGENSGEVFTTPIDGYMGSTFKKLWISDNLHIPYVLAFIRFYKDELRNSKKGAAIPHLNKEIFNNLIMGIPPIEEQKRIVQRLVEIMSAL